MLLLVTPRTVSRVGTAPGIQMVNFQNAICSGDHKNQNSTSVLMFINPSEMSVFFGELSELKLWNRILKSLIKVGCPSCFAESPCSCGHFKMCLTYVGPLVPEL